MRYSILLQIKNNHILSSLEDKIIILKNQIIFILVFADIYNKNIYKFPLCAHLPLICNGNFRKYIMFRLLKYYNIGPIIIRIQTIELWDIYQHVYLTILCNPVNPVNKAGLSRLTNYNFDYIDNNKMLNNQRR